MTATVLGAAFPGRVKANRKSTILGWDRVGNVDVVVNESKGVFHGGLIELKWAGPGNDIIYEAIYDLFKLSLATLLVHSPRGFLLTAAHKDVWAKSKFADLFETREHDAADLLARRLSDQRQTLAWDDLLRGSRGLYPTFVPEQIATDQCGRAEVGDWDLRAVEVSVPECEPIPLFDGWPHGQRPADARYPKVPPVSKFVDTAADVQIDPATLPENIELMRLLHELTDDARSDSPGSTPDR